jgi:hypothetical protein
MRFFQPLAGQVAMRARAFANVFMCSTLLGAALPAGAQDAPPLQPAAGASCTVSALNRNAPVAPDSSFTIYNIPGSSGPFRARATCSDGSVGQTAVAFPEYGTSVVYTGDIVWGRLDPTPVALGLQAASKQLGADQTAQLVATAVAADASTHDVTLRAQGTSYAISNALLASVTPDGLITVLPLFASGSSARVVASATNEGGVAGSYMFVLGPRGSLGGKVTRADGVTPVAGAQVTIVRNQPMEQVGTVLTDAGGNFALNDVNAGGFTLLVTDPVTGDRGQAASRIDTEGQTANVNLRLNGQGQVSVTVTDAANASVANAPVTLTALGGIRDTRTLVTDAGGRVVFSGVAAGDFTVSTRDPASMLVGTALGLLPAGGALPIALKLRAVGAIKGIVQNADGSNAGEGVQVRILSRERGIVSQVVTGPDGAFSFNTLPLADGPFTLDAFVDSRLRARLPGVLLALPNQVLTQDLRFGPVGTVRGLITDANNGPFNSVTLTLQSQEGLRQTFSGQAGPDGVFMIQGVPLGSYTITASTADGRSGTAAGNMPADGAAVVTNLQLAASGLVGTVFLRDGVTPAGEGVAVYLQRNPTEKQLALTLTDQSPGVIVTRTSALGQFSFPISTPDIYVLQAQDGDNRARTQAVVTAIVPGHPLTVNLGFLGKGSVAGTVRDAAGVAQANVPVSVKSVGAFTNTWETSTDAAGHYLMQNVYLGDLTVNARNPLSRLAGFANGRMIAEGDSLALDVTLAATGTVHGRALKANGTAAAAPLKIDLYVGANLVESQTLSAGNDYAFSLVPLGDLTIRALERGTGDMGIATSKLSTAGESRTLDVKLLGQGAVLVKVQDSDGEPVSGATVRVEGRSAFPASSTVVSDASGAALVQPVFNGDFSVSVTKPAQIGQISGSAQGTVVNGATVEATVTLSYRPVGTVKGTLFGPDGVTPRAGMVVEMAPGFGTPAYATTSDAAGAFSFANVEGGTAFTLTARNYDRGGNDRDRVRAVATGVQIGTQDQVVTRNLQMIGAGSVGGIVKRADGTTVPGITVTLTNPDPVYGLDPHTGSGTYSTTSDSDGRYTFKDMAAGTFTLLARSADAAHSLRAEEQGRIRFDGESLAIDLILVDNAVTMPYTLHDANAIPFDLAGDGSVVNGKNRAFTGTGADARGMRLDILVAGVPVPFLNGDGSIGRLTEARQQIEVDELHASGLNVTRRVFVPKTGYFARYLEVLENRTDAPITVGVRVTSNHSPSDSNPRIVDSSDGDSVLSVLDPINRDRWVVVDDQMDADPFVSSSAPATGHLFDGVNGARHVDSAGYELVGQTGKLTWQWDSVTVQPGQAVSLLHFAFSQLDRYRAREAALRLAQLPPEALAGLSAQERASVANFTLPADGIGNPAPLPAVDTGRVSGKVLSGDGVTPVPNTSVHFKSQHPLFGRDFYASSDASGDFVLAAKVDGSSSTLPVPLYGFNLDALHPSTAAQSAASASDFPPDVTAIVKDLVFNGTGNLRGTVKRSSGVVGAAAQIRLRKAGTADYLTAAGADGSYLMTGLAPHDYEILASVKHPQQPDGDCCGIEGKASATVVAELVTVADVVLEDVGSVSGIVRDGKGAPVAGAEMKLTDGSGQFRLVTVTDTAGRYRFTDVRLGYMTISATDAISKASGLTWADVAKDAETVADIQLKGFGTLNVDVRFARGQPAPGALIKLSTANPGDNLEAKLTDTSGHASFNLPVASYSISARHPDSIDDDHLTGNASATLSNSGDIVTASVSLPSAGAIKGTIVRPDGSTLAGGFPFTVKLLNGAVNPPKAGMSNSVGDYRAAGLALGTYLVTAYDPALNRHADAEAVIGGDGDERTVDLVLEDNRILLPADLYDANRFRFDVQGDGSLARGTMSSGVQSFSGAAMLSVDDQPFSGATSALLEDGKRQLAITQAASISGLQVTRKVYVPKGAYFARYLEVFDNPTAAPITVSAQVTSRYPGGQLINSTSKGATVSAADSWVVLDDEIDTDLLLEPQQPATAHVFGAPGAPLPPDQVELASQDGKPVLRQRWSGVMVPAGGKVALLHFVVQQINRAGAQAAVQRLAQLAPEAVDGLTDAELSAIANFKITAGTPSAVASLPALTGRIDGRVFEGDGVTVANGAQVTVQSRHPLFNRVWGLVRNADDALCAFAPAGTAIGSLAAQTVTNPVTQQTTTGAFSLQAALTDTDSIALPVDAQLNVVVQRPRACFEDHSGHPLTSIASRDYVVNGAVAMQQDVLFDSGILTGTINGPAGFSPTSGSVWRATDNPEVRGTPVVAVAADGSYVFPGLTPGGYDLVTSVGHPQGSPLRGERTGAIVTLGKTTVTDIGLQPAGSIAGVVLTASGQARAGAHVQIDGPAVGQQYDACTGCTRPDPVNVGKQAISRQTMTDTLGRYLLDAVPLGAYLSHVTDPVSGAVLQGALTLGAEGQQVVQNNTLLPLGAVRLGVKRANGAASVDAVVYLLADAVGYEKVAARTDAAGQALVASIPAGPYRLRVVDPAFSDDRFFDGIVNGTISADGEIQTVDLTLEDNRIALPIDWYDVNRFHFDIDRGGAIGSGTTALPGYRAFMGGASLEVNGQAFAGDSTAIADAGKRQAAISQPATIGGLEVTRKVYVPKGGYFARYVEIFSNPTASPITVQAKVGTGYQTAGLIDSSTKGSVVSGADRWVVLDDAQDGDPLVTPQQPSTAHVFGQSGAPGVPDLVQLAAATGEARQFVLGWTSLTVPAGGRVALMHFVVQQVNRKGAQAAAQRLSQLPPEALAALSSDDRAAIVNFAVPASGISALAPLPALTAKVSGRVLEGDATTPVNAVRVTVQSAHPLFNRVWGLARNPDCWPAGTEVDSLRSKNIDNVNPALAVTGAYSLQGMLSDVDSIALPADTELRIVAQETQACFNTYGGHAFTHIPSRVENVAGAASVHQDLLFDSAVLTGKVGGAADVGVSTGRVWRSSEMSDAGVALASDGSYVYPGLAPGSYDLLASVQHPQGSDLRGERLALAAVVGKVAADLALQPTGSLSGTLKTLAGAGRGGVQITLTGAAAGQQYDACANCAGALPVNQGKRDVVRQAYTDGSGVYRFNGVPAGSYSAAFSDALSGTTLTTVAVGAGQAVVQNLLLPAVASLRVTVLDGDKANAPVPNAQVWINPPSGQPISGVTDAGGVVMIAGATAGTVVVNVQKVLEGTNVAATASVAIGAADDGLTRDVMVALKRVAGSINVLVVDKANNNAPVPNAQVVLTDAFNTQRNVGQTGPSGTLFVSGVPVGAFSVLASATLNGAQAIASVTGTIVPATIAQTQSISIGLGHTPLRAKVLTFERERHLYSIPVNAGDVIALTIAGENVGQATAARAVEATVYQPDLSTAAQGYGYGPANGYAQTSTYRDLGNIVVSAAGNYSIAVNPYYSISPTPLGGYRLAATVNGVPVEIQPYLDGGTVGGVLRKQDGSPAPNRTVELSGSSPGLQVRATSAADGSYQFTGVPFGPAALRVLDPTTSEYLNYALVTLTPAAPAVVQDFVTWAKTTLQTTIQLGASVPIPGSSTNFSIMVLDEMSGANERSAGTVKFSGTRTSSTVTFAVYGEAPVIRTTHPTNAAIGARVTIASADGQTLPLILNLASTPVSGKVLQWDGQPAAGVSVAADGITSAVTNAAGVYQFASLPYGAPVKLSAPAPVTSVRSYTSVIPLLGQSVVVPDLTLGGIGFLTGVVVDTAGAPLANNSMSVRYPTDDAGSLASSSSMTGANGVYMVGGLPTSTPLTLSATTNTFFSKTVTSPFTVNIPLNGSQVTAPPLVVDMNPIIRVDVRDPDGQLVPKAYSLYVRRSFESSGGWNVGSTNPLGSFDILTAPSGLNTIMLGGTGSFGPPPWVSATVDVQEPRLYPLTLVSPAVKGTVRFSDGTVVPNPTVSMRYKTGSFTLFIVAANTTTDGQYAMYGMHPSSFVVGALDPVTGLGTSAPTSAVVQAGEEVVVDLTLEPSGTVKGTLLDNTGAPVVGAQVYVRSVALGLDRSTFSDAAGHYTVDHVAVGQVSVTAQNPANQTSASGAGELTTDGQVLNIDLTWTP